jgi:hypothetical protein
VSERVSSVGAVWRVWWTLVVTNKINQRGGTSYVLVTLVDRKEN